MRYHVINIVTKQVLRAGNVDFQNDGAFDPINEEIIDHEFEYSESPRIREWFWNSGTSTFDIGNLIDQRKVIAETETQTGTLKTRILETTLADDDFITIPMFTKKGKGFLIVGDNEERVEFFGGNANYTKHNDSANIAFTNTDGNFCILVDNPVGHISFVNRLGSEKEILIVVEYI